MGLKSDAMVAEFFLAKYDLFILFYFYYYFISFLEYASEPLGRHK